MGDVCSLSIIWSLFFGNQSVLKKEITPECRNSQIPLRPFYGPFILISLVYTLIVVLQTRRRSCCRPDRRRRKKQPTPSEQQDDQTLEVGPTETRSDGCCQRSKYFRLYPGLPLPMNSMFYRHSTMAYACAYLCAFNIIAGIFTEYYGMKQALPNAPIWFGMLFRILAIAFLSATLLPVFISITRGGFFCWTCGALYSLTQSILLILSFARSLCLGFHAAMRQASLQFPTLFGFLYLTFYFCQQLILHRKALHTDWLRYRLNKPSHYVYDSAEYVQSRLRPPARPGTTISATSTERTRNSTGRCCGSLRDACGRLVNPPSGFTYPPILIWSLTVSVLLQYFLVNQSLTWFYNLAEKGRHSISARFPDINMTIWDNLASSNAHFVFQLFELPKNTSAEEIQHRQYALIYYWIDIFWLCILVASFLAIFCNVINVFRIMLNYQDLCFAIYRRGYEAVPAMKRLLDPFKVTRGNILYPSYQIALMACGYYLQVLIYGTTFLLLAIVVTMNAFTRRAFLVHFFRTSWPSIILITIFGTVQQLVIRFLFTKHRGKSYGFNNVRSLQVYAFFASFYNVIFGLISGVGRILYCPISSAICISRLDISPLGVPLQNMDTGYMAFLGFLYADTMVNHPITKTFLWILVYCRQEDLADDSSFDSALLIEVQCFEEWLAQSRLASTKKINSEEPGTLGPVTDLLQPGRLHISELSAENNNLAPPRTSLSLRRSKQARNRWFLAYSLLRNPDIRRWRKFTLTQSDARTEDEHHHEQRC